MNIRNAILLAADHIQSNPQDFNFFSIEIPGACGTPGCALGWVGFFYGVKERSAAYRGISLVCADDLPKSFGDTPPMHMKQDEFYLRMRAFDPMWASDAPHCAKALRLYADKYHPETVPNWEALATAPLPVSVS